ncbi:MAG: hypothetical protein IJA97_06860 [Clostridia bacterium]|nr:hypothetical protein [Clostridia bacterium]
MILIIQILAVVYLLAVNFYAFMLMRLQKEQATNPNGVRRRITDGRILLSGTLGGALGVYLSTFILKYRRDSVLIMVLMPLLVAITAFIVVSAFLSGFWLG